VLKANYTFMVPADRDRRGRDRRRPGAGALARAGQGQRHLLPRLFRQAAHLHRRRVLPHASELVSADLVLMSEADFRRLLRLYPDGHYTDIALSVANPQEVRNVA
jgi:hypothetical protein